MHALAKWMPLTVAAVIALGACGSGDDGARFVDNGDGTISDHQFGLKWEKKVKLDGETDSLNLHDADNTYVWAGACNATGELCQPDAESESACMAGAEHQICEG